MKETFQNSLNNKNEMTIAWELVPGRGAREKSQESALKAAEEAAKGDRVHALTITDNPGGNPAILADYLGMEILRMGIEPLVHFSCKDKNRYQMESQLYALNRAEVNNLLVLTGDYPEALEGRRPKPVFDMDSTHTLELITKMNNGLEVQGRKGPIKYHPTSFFTGAAVSPFKATEAEQVTQYFKLEKRSLPGPDSLLPNSAMMRESSMRSCNFLKCTMVIFRSWGIFISCLIAQQN